MAVCYIVSAGDCDKIEIKKNNDDFVIAADGGLEYCQRDNIVPDLIIGDFDSLGFVPESDNVLVLPVEKDDTDTSFAVKYAMEHEYEKIVIFGGCGGKRPDHTFANISLLAYISKNGGQGFLDNGEYTVTAVTDCKISFNNSLRGDISVFSFDEKSFGVSEKGLKYSLDGAVLESTNGIGTSNSFTGAESSVSVEKGTLIVFFQGKYFDAAIDK